MAIDEYESPGLNRRLYNRRLRLKNSSTSARADETGFDNPGFQDDAGSTTTKLDGREQTTITTNAVVETVPDTSRQIQQEISPPTYQKRSRLKEASSVVMKAQLEMQTSDSGVDVESLQLEGTASTSSSPAGLTTIKKDRNDSINSTQSDPVIKNSDHIVSDRQINGSHMHSLRIETSRNTPWQSADTLVKIHVDVLELLHESDMLGPYCLQSKIKRCKLRSSERPPALKFSPKENRFVDRRTSFDDLDAYYIDFTKPLMEEYSPINGSKSKSSALSKDKEARTGLENVWNPQNFEDDLVRYSQLLMHKHKRSSSLSESDLDRISKKTTNSINSADEVTTL